MTTVLVLARSATSWTRVEGTLRWAVLVVLASGLHASAAGPPVHWLHAGAMPPGAIGSLRLHRGGPLSGYFQPVQIRAPQGARIALAMEDTYSAPQFDVALVGMLIGPVYRLEVTNIPNHPGLELFPTVEVIDRLYPPPGLAPRFPILVELTQDELEMAARGMFVTRVIYVEEPSIALPVRQTMDGEQPWMEARRGEDPLVVADTLGRPVAILRIGGRVPAAPGTDAACGNIVPPFRLYDPNQVCPNPCPPLDDDQLQKVTPASLTFPTSVLPRGVAPAAAVVQTQLTLSAPSQTDAFSTAGPMSIGPAIDEPTVVSDGGAVGELNEGSAEPINEYVGGEFVDGVCAGATGACALCVDGALVGPSDEYLCDGGDFGSPAGVHADWTIDGLEQEDAIAHYDTLDGRVIVTPSNRVCIYAPRFAAVRRVVNPMAHEQPEFVNQAVEELIPAKAAEAQPVASSLQRHKVAIDLGQQPPSLYRQREQAGCVENLQATMDVFQSLAPYADLQIIRTGAVSNAEKPWLLLSTESAIALTGVQAPQVLISGKAAAAQLGVQQPGIIYQTDGPDNPRLRLLKLASCGNAQPGDAIEFTLRFDNIGDQTIGNVTIVDNLSTRFEYIPDSAQSSIDANFITTPNDNESTILRWEIKPPLKPGEGGVLRFRVWVR